MKIPSLDEARAMIKEAAETRASCSADFNPRIWIEHVEFVAQNAKVLATFCRGLNPDDAYILGLLHDIGIRSDTDGKTFRALSGYQYLKKLGFDDAARIALTHAFIIKDNGHLHDCPDQEAVKNTLAIVKAWKYDDYDRLIQLCNCLNDKGRNCTVLARMNALAAARSMPAESLDRLRVAVQELKDYFDERCNCNIYRIIGLD